MKLDFRLDYSKNILEFILMTTENDNYFLIHTSTENNFNY